MVAAAFIGPGTVTSATLAGTSYGYTLLWAVTFATISACVMQEMSMRLGVAGRMGLGEAIRLKLKTPFAKWFAVILVIASIFVGNAAYEAGNITGVSLGAGLAWGESTTGSALVALLTALIAIALILYGRFKLIEQSLILMVALMGLVFLFAVFFSPPNLVEAFKAMFIPEIPSGSLLTVVALIGTTIVPYNLFLHASSAAAKWPDASSLSKARWDTVLSVTFGGLITMAILIAAAAGQSRTGIGELSQADLGTQLTPLLGKWSTVFTGIGFIAAGLSSAITAPLAASYATTEILGDAKNLKSPRFRMVSVAVILIGLFFALFPTLKPQTIILFAQVTNGFILPLIAAFLLWVMNDATLLKQHKNGLVANIAGATIIGVAVLLGAKSIAAAFGWL